MSCAECKSEGAAGECMCGEQKEFCTIEGCDSTYCPQALNDMTQTVDDQDLEDFYECFYCGGAHCANHEQVACVDCDELICPDDASTSCEDCAEPLCQHCEADHKAACNADPF